MQLQQIDLDKLSERFHIHVPDADRVVLAYRARELMQKESVDQLMRTYAPLIHALEPAPAATYTASALRNLSYAMLYMLSIHNKALDLSLDNLHIELLQEGPYYFYGFRLDRWDLQDGPSGEEERAAWREEVLARFYGQTLRPLMEQLSASVSVHIAQLWGQLPTGMLNYLEQTQADASDPAVKQRIRDDVAYLQTGLPAEVFGRKRNPFHVTYTMVEHTVDPEKQLPLKSACCLYYRTGKEIFCYTCPKLTDEKRAARLAELRSATRA